MSQIYCQITPEGMGEDYQDLMVAVEYGKRLANISGAISEDSIYKLVHDYPSHDFVIDKIEAKTLFRSIDDPGADLYSLMGELGGAAFVPSPKRVTVESLSKIDDPHSAASEGINHAESKGNGVDAESEQKPVVAPVRRGNRRGAARPS